MRRLLTILALPIVLATCSFAATLAADTLPIVPTTTLAAETGINTSVAPTFTAQTNGNAAATNISKVPFSSLLYPGSDTVVYAHLMAWFGDASHMNVGYTSSDPAQVQRQVADAMGRGIAGFFVDWYGPNNATPNNTMFPLRAQAEAQGTQFSFGINYDGGALGACNNTPGCDLTQQAIGDLTYAYNNFEVSPAYVRLNGRPVVMFFDPDRYTTLNWPLIMASVPGNPMFIFRNSGGFTHAQTSGSYAWIILDATNPDDWAQSYLDNFLSTGMQYPAQYTFSAVYKGFNDNLAAWTAHRIMNQSCGQTWLDTFQEINQYYSAAHQLESLQLVTWNDYEEGSELETGIDNCAGITASVSGASLNWLLTGNEATVDHYTVFVSTDGQNLMSLGDVPAGTHSFNLASVALGPSAYTLFVKAVGKPGLTNHMSGAVSYTLNDVAPTARLALSATSGPAPLNVTASTAASTAAFGAIINSAINFGDGASGAGSSASHSYTKAGSYTVTATVTDAYGVSSTATQTVNVINQPPVAQLSLSAASGAAPLLVTASTAASTDADGAIASSMIDFGDGIVLSGPSATHSYPAAGAYLVKATVTDNMGASSSVTQLVTATPAVAQGVMVASPAAGATVGSPVHFVAQASATQGIVAMKIYVDNVAQYSVSAASINVSLALRRGTHNVTVQAWDSLGTVYKKSFTLAVH